MKKILENKLFRFLANTCKFIIVIIMIMYISFIAIQRLSGNKSIFGYRLFTVVTGSMQGVYDINDVIAVKDFNPNNLKIGDDVAYIGNRAGLENKIVTHRIINIEDTDKGKRFFTKGINSDNADPSISEDQILGRVIGVVPVITQINHILKTQLGFFTIIFCPLVLIIVLEVLQTITDYQLEKNEIQRIEKDKNISSLDNGYIVEKEEVDIL